MDMSTVGGFHVERQAVSKSSSDWSDLWERRILHERWFELAQPAVCMRGVLARALPPLSLPSVCAVSSAMPLLVRQLPGALLLPLSASRNTCIED
jgi:hypothetical protein